MNGFWRSACVQRNAVRFREGHSFSTGTRCRSKINDPSESSYYSGVHLHEENKSGGVSPAEKSAQQ